jgi:hypothetical protein
VLSSIASLVSKVDAAQLGRDRDQRIGGNHHVGQVLSSLTHACPVTPVIVGNTRGPLESSRVSRDANRLPPMMASKMRLETVGGNAFPAKSPVVQIREARGTQAARQNIRTSRHRDLDGGAARVLSPDSSHARPQVLNIVLAEVCRTRAVPEKQVHMLPMV